MWLGPSVARGDVRVKATPARVLLGGGGPQTVTLEIDVASTVAVSAGDLVVRSTAGRVTDLERIGSGKFRALLQPPTKRFPQLAVITAANVGAARLGEAPDVGTAGVAYSARISLGGTTEANASMEVFIGDRRFGPTRADAQGKFTLPVVVPPGVGWARGISTDSLGNAAESKINLYLPAVRRLHAFAYPEVLIANGRDRGWLFLTTVTPTGAPVDTKVRVRSARGSLGLPEQVRKGVVRLAYLSPRGVGDGFDRLEFRIREAPKAIPVDLQLMAGAPSAATVDLEPPMAPGDGSSTVRARVRVTDDAGNPVRGQRVRVRTASAQRDATPDGATYVARVGPSTRVGEEKVYVDVRPVAPVCRRPTAQRVAGDEAQIVVVDVRGLPCMGEVAIGHRGAQLTRGKLSETGHMRVSRDALAAWKELRITVTAGGETRTVLPWVPSKTFGVEAVKVAAPFSSETTMVWRVPTELELSWEVISKDDASIALRLRASKPVDLRERVTVRASAGNVTLDFSEPGQVMVKLKTPSSPADIDLIATDTSTGLSAWLRVD